MTTINMKHIFYILILLLAMASFAYADTPDTNIINVYDANGNLVTGDGNYYEYNDANQLVRVRQGDQNGAVVAEYFYDYSGQRIKKIENGVTTYYIGKHFEKQIGGTEEGNSSYYFAEGERVAKKDPSGNIYFYHSDHLGGTNAVTDSAGTVVARTDYLPFGDIKQGGTGNEKYSYTGKEKDKTDLYYFEARYNSPMFKHFTQADVASPNLSDPQDLNRYSYVGNNPMSYVDPTGFAKCKMSKKKCKEYKKALKKWEKYAKEAAEASKEYADKLDTVYKITEYVDDAAGLITTLACSSGLAQVCGLGAIDKSIETAPIVIKLAKGELDTKDAYKQAISLSLDLFGGKLINKIAKSGGSELFQASQKYAVKTVVFILKKTSNWIINKAFEKNK